MKIKQIFDGDYGCEELQLGQKPKVSVTLVDDAGNEKYMSVEDDWLRENGLDVSEEYLKIMEHKKIPVEAMKKLPQPMNLIKVVAKSYDYLDSDLKKEGFGSRQHMDV